ncbi:histidine-containing phosphotransfer protein 1 isoform X6 [Beta vulgaris subsp. vulgaris]|uniref:histidine-containing phosphotransfer protein 1 isoform X6 n=1 Tax=Beta vulgaris subsp. vulgaris TaxID=3555 RepID=UPI00203731C4|nr:histidine-containing phosphotransfer protein 1 isoform X6 [Beta vulgaris subsp. vulgaris]
MDVVQLLERQFIDYMKSLYMEHYLDDQFTQLQKLADESNPDFVYEVVTLFFQDSEKLIDNLTKALIGAHRVKNQCVKFRAYCEERNHDGSMICEAVNQCYLIHLRIRQFTQNGQFAICGGLSELGNTV